MQVYLLAVQLDRIRQVCRAVVVCAVRELFGKNDLPVYLVQKFGYIELGIGSALAVYAAQSQLFKRRAALYGYNAAVARSVAAKEGVTFPLGKAGIAVKSGKACGACRKACDNPQNFKKFHKKIPREFSQGIY